jgi:hypothetical protein
MRAAGSTGGAVRFAAVVAVSLLMVAVSATPTPAVSEIPVLTTQASLRRLRPQG